MLVVRNEQKQKLILFYLKKHDYQKILWDLNSSAP